MKKIFVGLMLMCSALQASEIDKKLLKMCAVEFGKSCYDDSDSSTLFSARVERIVNRIDKKLFKKVTQQNRPSLDLFVVKLSDSFEPKEYLTVAALNQYINDNKTVYFGYFSHNNQDGKDITCKVYNAVKTIVDTYKKKQQ